MKKSKIWINRIWLLFVIAAGSFITVYFELNPVWAVVCMVVVFQLPFAFDMIITIHDAAEYSRKHKTPGNTPKKLKGFAGSVPIYDN